MLGFFLLVVGVCIGSVRNLPFPFHASVEKTVLLLIIYMFVAILFGLQFMFPTFIIEVLLGTIF